MCGIAGIVSLTGAPLPDGAVQRMTATLEHRGPDDYGYWQDQRCAFGHRRLTIIDLSANGRQPLANSDETTWITYNGEVYNFRELRGELARRGHTFSSKTDTEVVAHLYDEDGIKFLQRLDGMFAFGLWDSTRRRLLLARDRLGIKPLYYARAGGLLLFASEVKAILASGLVETAPNIDAIASYLAYRHPLSPATMFAGIESLPAGHNLIAEDGNVRTEQYWDLHVPHEREDLGEDYYIEQTRDLLRQAVRKRLMSDVPLGAYLSGGLDSSIVVSLMAQELGDRLKTYAVGFDGEDGDELPYARLVAERYGTDHTEVRLNAERYLELLPELIRKRDAPLAVPNEVPLYEMSRVLKQEITVVLSGEGADEVFAGYGDYCRIPFDLRKARTLARLPAPLRSLLSGGMARKYGGRMEFESEIDHFLAGYKWFDRDEGLSLLTPDAAQEVRSGGRPAFEAVFRNTEGLPYYDRVLYALEKIHLQNLLARVDSMTMATSVEGRVPFVDHALVEAVTRMPLHYKLRWRSPLHHARALLSYSDTFPERDDTTKYILRAAFADVLPGEIVQRRKVGFKVPLERWFRGDLMSYARELLLSTEARSRGIVDTEAVARWLDRGEANGGEFGQKVWMLVNLELWFRLYFPDGRALDVSRTEQVTAGQARL
ncbi:MAG: asparagine synthase (glutamine-hydrolyzing) [Chloroflexi bacterium]|nr:asparagine synthase (glutamine-hydrolyzing) [Chloroflexota bacterium]